MMDNKSFLNIIEEEKINLIDELDKLFKNVEISNISSTSKNLEIFLKEYLKILLLKYSKELVGLQKSEQNIYLYMEDNEQLYSLTIESDILKFNTLTVFFSPIGIKVKQENIKKFNIKVNGYGKVRQVKIIYFSELPIQLDKLNSLIINIFDIGYGWFKTKVEDLVSNEKVTLSENLYGYIKKVIPSETLRKNLWFASITDNYGFRLVERNVALSLFEFIDKNASVYGDSTNQFVAEILSTKLPGNQLLMQKAIEANCVLDGDISDASYFKEGNIYAAAMSSLYGTNKFTIHPVYISNNVNVLLLYPTELRNILENIIEQHKDALSEISQKSTENLYKFLKYFDKSDSFGSGEFGEFIGGLMGGFAKSMSGP